MLSRRRALLRFVALGAALFAAERFATARLAGGEVALGPSERAEARAAGAALLGRPPAPDELAALLEARLDEEILYREALARGLDREDGVVRRRLASNLRLLGALGDTETLHREAVALGLDRTDTVVRRRLLERVRLEIEAEGRGPEPGEAELRTWLERHPELARGPRRFAGRHVLFEPARRGARAESDARRALARLAQGGAPPPGDPCLAPPEAPLRSEALVARLLGPGFAAALFEAPAGAWAGPLRSSLGLHVVRVEARDDGAALPFDALRARARDALRAERAGAALERFLTIRRGENCFWGRCYFSLPSGTLLAGESVPEGNKK